MKTNYYFSDTRFGLLFSLSKRISHFRPKYCKEHTHINIITNIVEDVQTCHNAMPQLSLSPTKFRKKK